MLLLGNIVCPISTATVLFCRAYGKNGVFVVIVERGSHGFGASRGNRGKLRVTAPAGPLRSAPSVLLRVVFPTAVTSGLPGIAAKTRLRGKSSKLAALGRPTTLDEGRVLRGTDFLRSTRLRSQGGSKS